MNIPNREILDLSIRNINGGGRNLCGVPGAGPFIQRLVTRVGLPPPSSTPPQGPFALSKSFL
uniref:Uncharacterized protein n=1 Tax=Romanomermis culicivorax TaxID=13658 RepID=A0A915L5Z7_ROMCU